MKQKLIVKSNILLQQPLYRTPIELKIFSRIILAIRKNPEEDAHRFQVKELLEMFGVGLGNYCELKKIAKGMFRVVDLNPNNKEFHLSVVFTDIFIHEEGFITFKVNKKIKPYILNLTNNFTQYYFNNIAQLKSNFSIRMYEFLKQYEKIGKRKTDLVRLKNFLNIEKDKYIKYNNFKIKVLLVAQKELKEKTDIYFEFKEIKTGRKITDIEFIIKRKASPKKSPNKPTVPNELTEKEQALKTELQGHGLDESMINKLILEMRSTQQEKEPGNELTDEQQALKNTLRHHGIAENMANELVLTCSAEQIEENIAYTDNQADIKNIAGYLLKAIQNNYALNSQNEIKALEELETEEKRKQAEAKVRQYQVEQKEAKKQSLMAKLTKKFDHQERDNFINSLSEEEQQAMLDELLEEEKINSFLVASIKKVGLKSPFAYSFIIRKIDNFSEKKAAFIAEGLKAAGYE